MISVEDNNIDLLKANWKVLVILDACRYDIFKQMYADIIHHKSKLKKAKTFSSGTQEWMSKNFYNEDCSDIIYMDPIVMFNKFIPRHNFFKVVMVWKKKWNYEYGTIMPQDMTDITLEQIKQHPEKRFIVHYHQPHAPYLLPEFLGMGEIDTPEKIQQSIKENKKKNKDLPHFLQGNMKKILGNERAWNWLIRLGMEPLDYYGKIYKLYGEEGLVRGYTETLKLVLDDVNRLIEACDRKIVITSDHSKNLNGSMANLKNEYIPWLEIGEEGSRES